MIRIKRKPIIIVLSLLLFVLVLAASMWVGINYIFIPKILIPGVRWYIENNLSGDIKLSIKDISFHPFKGFQLYDIRLSGHVPLKNVNDVLSVKEADIDLVFLALLKKKIEVQSMDLYNVTGTIGRDAKGEWNYKSFLNFVKKISTSGDVKSYSFAIDQFTINNSSVCYVDVFKEEDSIEKNFVNINVIYKRVKDNFYCLMLEGHAENNPAESIGIIMNCEIDKAKLSGVLKYRMTSLAENWGYYIDHMLSPWKMSAENIAVNLSFIYEGDSILLDGQYTIDAGNINYEKIIISGKAVVKHILNVKNGSLAEDAKVSADFENLSVFAGDNKILDEGLCKSIISKDKIDFIDISGSLLEIPVSLAGEFSIGEINNLVLKGKILDADNFFSMDLFSKDKASVVWKVNKDKSWLKIILESNDFENLMFNSSVSGVVVIEDILRWFKKEHTIKGEVDISGSLSGFADNVESFGGELKIGGKNIVILEGELFDFDLDAEIKNGILNGNLHKADLYKGELSGSIYIDSDLWAAEIDIEKVNLLKFSKIHPDFKGIKGFFTWNFVCGSSWKEIDIFAGGGYFRFKDSYLWDAPLFSEAKKGIREAVNVDLPDKFNLLEGNFSIDRAGLNIENIYCDVPGVKFDLKGKISFYREIDIVIGAALSKAFLKRSIRQVLMPYTIVFDVIKDSVEIHVYGKWPDFNHETRIQPFALFTAIFPLAGQSANPHKYTLEKCLGILREQKKQKIEAVVSD